MTRTAGAQTASAICDLLQSRKEFDANTVALWLREGEKRNFCREPTFTFYFLSYVGSTKTPPCPRFWGAFESLTRDGLGTVGLSGP